MTPIRDPILERPLPSSVESERAVLGSIILYNFLMSQAIALLKPEDFYVPSHRRIFLAMISLFEKEQAITPQNIANVLKRDNSLDACGGLGFVAGLIEGIVPAESLRSSARVIKGKKLLRDLVSFHNHGTALCLEDEGEPEEILAQVEARLMDLIRGAAKEERKGARSFAQVAEHVKNEFSLWRSGRTTALRTGIPELDSKLKFGGLAKGDLIYIGAVASVGKTALALQILKSAAQRGHRGLFFSLEMDETSIFLRALSAEGQIDNWKLRPDMFTYGETMDKVQATFPIVAGLPAFIDDTARELGHIEAIARDFVRNQGGELIVVDYQQLMDVILKRRGGSRHEEVAEGSKRLKALAHSLRVPLIATTQLKPGSTRDNRRPELDDVRESGQLGMDADLVLFPYSLDKDDDRDIRPMRLYCPKQRNGKRGWEIEIDFWAHYQTFKTVAMLSDEQYEQEHATDLQFDNSEREAIALQDLAPDTATTFDFGKFDPAEFTEDDEDIRNA